MATQIYIRYVSVSTWLIETGGGQRNAHYVAYMSNNASECGSWNGESDLLTSPLTVTQTCNAFTTQAYPSPVAFRCRDLLHVVCSIVCSTCVFFSIYVFDSGVERLFFKPLSEVLFFLPYIQHKRRSSYPIHDALTASQPARRESYKPPSVSYQRTPHRRSRGCPL